MTQLSESDIDELLIQRHFQKQRDPLSQYIPHPKQREFHESLAQVTLFIAGNGSGKTYTGVHEAAMAATGRHFVKGKYPVPTRGRIGGERPALENEIIPMLHWLLDPYLARSPRRNSIGMEYQWYLKNGSYFDILTYDQDDKKWESVSLDWMWADEPFRESIWSAITSRMRRGEGGHIFPTMTPLFGAAWMYEKFVVASEKGGEYAPRVIRASIWDNCIENGGYVSRKAIERMIADYDEELKDARIDGKFVVMRDLVHSIFNPEVHVLDPEITPERIRDEKMQVHGVLDPHQVRPPAYGLIAIDSNNFRYVIDEFPNYFEGIYKGEFYNKIKACKVKNYEKHIEIFHEMEEKWGGNITKRYVDPRFCKVASPNSTRTVLEEFNYAGRKYGMRFKPAIVGADMGVGEIASGILAINKLLYYKPDTSIFPSLLLNYRCANFIRALQFLRVDRYTGSTAEGKAPSEELLEEFKDFDDLLRYSVKSVKGYKNIIVTGKDGSKPYEYRPHSILTAY